jgi:hypothetical protein
MPSMRRHAARVQKWEASFQDRPRNRLAIMHHVRGQGH